MKEGAILGMLQNRKVQATIGIYFLLMLIIVKMYWSSGNVPEKAGDFNWSANNNSNWLLEIDSHARKVKSQGGQDGILEYIFENIGTTNKFFVEFGFNQPDYERATSGPNTQYLYQNKGFRGVLLDGDRENKDINLYKRWIKPETIVEALKQLGTPVGLDYVSVDIDSADCFVALEIACKLRPRVMTVELNSNYPIGYHLANIGQDYRFKGDRAYGCSASSHDLIAKKCNYSLVAVVTDLDTFWIRNDLIPGVKMQPSSYFSKHIPYVVHSSLTKYPKQKLQEFICDFKVWLDGGAQLGEYQSCIEAAQPQVNKLIDAGIM